MMERHHHRGILPPLVTTLLIVFLYLPLVLVVLFSFQGPASLSLPLHNLTLHWYGAVFHSSEFHTAIENSLIVASCVAVVTFILGTVTAFGLSRVPARIRGPLGLALFLPMTLPGLFLGLALLTYFSRLHMRLSLTTVIIGHVVQILPFFLLIARVALERLDVSLEEAAASLGASPLVVFRRVTLPQVLPTLIGAAALSFMLSLDEFVVTFFTIGSGYTLPILIYSLLRRQLTPTINVVSTLLLTVTLALWVGTFLLLAVRERRRLGLRADAAFVPTGVAA
jgi:spermidine/putrescine transport system permease protein